MGYAVGYYPVTSETALNATLSEIYATMGDRTAKFINVSSRSGDFMNGFTYLCELYRADAEYGVARFITYGSSGATVLTKSLFGGGWKDLEYVNPPMHLGVEYRTAERHMGKPVYTMAFNFGTLPNTSTSFIGMPEGPSNATAFVSAVAVTNEGSLLNIIDSVNKYSIRVRTLGDYSAYQAHIIVKYTKE